MDTVDFGDFLKVEMRVGRIARAEDFPKARKPAFRLWIDFGPELGEKKTSAQLTRHYTLDALVGRLVVAAMVVVGERLLLVKRTGWQWPIPDLVARHRRRIDWLRFATDRQRSLTMRPHFPA